MNKIYGRFSREEIRNIFARYRNLMCQLDAVKLKHEIDPSLIQPWHKWYEMPYEEHLASYAYVIGTPDQRLKIQESPRELVTLFADSKSGEPSTEIFPHLPDAVIPEIYACWVAIRFQILSIGMFSEPLSSLVKKASEGSDTAFFEAVLVDRSVQFTAMLTPRISRAQLLQDNDFMKALAKASAGKKPKRPKSEFDQLRYMIEVLQEGLDVPLTAKELCEVLVDDLRLYPDTSDYSYRAFESHITKRNQRLRN